LWYTNDEDERKIKRDYKLSTETGQVQ
jgi:hypothetical protein